MERKLVMLMEELDMPYEGRQELHNSFNRMDYGAKVKLLKSMSEQIIKNKGKNEAKINR